MFSKKIYDIRQFTIILTIGTIISNVLLYVFRIIAILLLKNGDYGLLVIIIRTFTVMLPFSSFLLHINLTREIREANNETSIQKIFKNFVVSYTITSFSSFIAFIFLGFYFLDFVNILLIFFLALCLVFNSFSEFFIGLSNGYKMPIKTISISIMNCLIRGLLALISVFFIFLQNLNWFIFFFGIGNLGSFLLGLYFYKTQTREYLSKKISIEKNKIKKYIKNSSFLLSTNFIKTFILLIISVIAFSLLSDLSFKVFDLSLLIISFIGMVSISLTNALNAKQNLKKLNNIKFIKKNIIPVLIINILILIFLIFTDLDIIVLKIFLGAIQNEAKYFIRISLLITIPMIISAYFGGKILNIGMYSKYFVSTIFGLLISLIFVTIALITNLPYLLIIGLVFEKISSALFLIIFDYFFK